MNAILILSIFLIWVMACSVCMLWFGSATQRTNPHNDAVHGHSSPAVFWGAIFAICSAGWLLIQWWARH